MKTLELKLKKYVLIADAENGFNHFKIYDDEIGFIFTENGIPRKELVKGSYKFLCKGSGLTEEIASELVETHKNCRRYFDYKIKERNRFFDLSIPSFISAVESKGFYWLEKECDNQFCENGKVDVGYNTFLNCQVCEEAEEKTFRNPLIFVKK